MHQRRRQIVDQQVRPAHHDPRHRQAAGTRFSRRARNEAMKVLIVDGNPADLLLQADLLALKGFTVTHARSAVDGMKSITTDNPDLVIADVMPYDTTYEDPNAVLRAMVTIFD